MKTSLWVAPAIGAVFLCLCPQVANAQSDRAADRADSRLRRLDAQPAATIAQKARAAAKAQALRLSDTLSSVASLPGETLTPIESTPSTEAPKLWTLKVSAPATYNSNIEGAASDEDGAIHFTPSAALIWSKETSGGAKVGARFIADADIFTGEDGADASGLLGQVGVDLAKTTFRGMTPYIYYRAQDLHDDFFGDHDVTLHTVALGLKREIEMSETTTFSMDFQAARREASKSASEQNRATMTLGLEGAFNEGASWSIEQVVQRRDFSGGENEGRDDWNFSTTLGFSVDLGASGASLDLTIYFERNDSDRPGNDYDVWDIGPAITLKRQW